MTQAETNFAVLIDGLPPAGAEVHVLPNPVSWERDDSQRTIAVTRTDGSRWYCRAILPCRVNSRVPATDKAAPMPDGRHFSTGYYVVDRDDPAKFNLIMAPRDIAWSNARDVVFYVESDHVSAFGRAGFLWTCRLPGADPKDIPLVDHALSDRFQCTARQKHLNADGEMVFMSYVIDVASGAIARQWIDDPVSEDVN